MRAKVIRKLIDEIRMLRRELARPRPGRPAPKPDLNPAEPAQAVG